MKTWMKPITEVQDFVANEYVAACWGVECVVPQMDINGDWGVGTHREETCGQKDNQSIREVSEGVFQIAEVNHDMTNRDLVATIYPNGFNNEGVSTITLDQVKSLNGKTIYWSTRFWGTTYRHEGIVQFDDASRTNHS